MSATKKNVLFHFFEPLSPYIDLHTHHHTAFQEVETVYNLMLNEPYSIPEGFFSAGLHPWYADKVPSETIVDRLGNLLSKDNFVAIGEIGLDKACDVPLQMQMDMFELQLKVAAEYKKPVIIHCVRAWNELIEICANFETTKILHGFHGSSELTRKLLKHNFSFSIGNAILNPKSKIQDSIQYIPLSSLFCETDNATSSIKFIYKGICNSLHLNSDDFRDKIFENFEKLKRFDQPQYPDRLY